MAASRWHCPRAALAGLVLLAMSAARGAEPQAPEVVLRVNGQALSAPTFAWLERNAQRAFASPHDEEHPPSGGAPLTAQNLLERLIEEQLLAEEAVRTQAVSLLPAEKVQLERRRLRFVQHLLGREAVQRELERYRLARNDYRPEEVRALLRPPAQPRPGQPREGPDAYDVRGARAKVLLGYRLPGRAPGQVTLEDVYLYARRRNTMIAELHVRDGGRKAIDALAEELYGLQLVEWMASRGDDLARTLQEFARIDTHQLLSKKARTAWGFRELHGPNEAFEKVRREVSEAEVAEWAASHPDPRRGPLSEARWAIAFQIAEEKVRTRFEALRQRLWARAKIELNPRFASATVQGPGR